MQKFRFREFRVYHDAIKFRQDIKLLAKKYFPSEEKFMLFDQIVRAANSVVLNIAEGADRGTDKDFALFLNRAHTSVSEVVACLDIALEDKYISVVIHKKFLQMAIENPSK